MAQVHAFTRPKKKDSIGKIKDERLKSLQIVDLPNGKKNIDGKEFDINQAHIIIKAKNKGVYLLNYVNETFNYLQMNEVLYGILQDVDVSYYSSFTIDAGYMREFRIGLKKGVDVDQMYELIDKYPVVMTTEMRKALQQDVDLMPFIETGLYSVEQIRQIRIGYYNGLSEKEVYTYAQVSFSENKMRRLRKILEKSKK